jgi:hypothetical protein
MLQPRNDQKEHSRPRMPFKKAWLLVIALTVGSVCYSLLFEREVQVDNILMKWNIQQTQTDPASAIDPLLSYSVTDPWKRELFARLDRIRLACGELCNINDAASYAANSVVVSPGAFPQIKAKVDCDALMNSDDIDAGDTTVPYPPPEELMPYYMLNGMVNVKLGHRHTDIYLGGQARQNVWTKEMVEEGMEQVVAGNLHGTYGVKVTNIVRDKLKNVVKGKEVLVIGSEQPWVETICLALGASMVTTLEYGSITSHHPKIKTIIPSQFRESYQDGTLGKFDVIVSWSSLEHSGLGRYGDALNPWGDVLAVARAWCVTKPGGKMLLGIPTGFDAIEFNAHRWYGEVRWPLITANWKNINPGDFSGFRGKNIASTGFLFEKV